MSDLESRPKVLDDPSEDAFKESDTSNKTSAPMGDGVFFFAGLFILLMGLSLFFVLPRLSWSEEDNELCYIVDGKEIMRSLKAINIGYDEAARRLSSLGVNGIGVSRLSINDLLSEGLIELVTSDGATPFARGGYALQTTPGCQRL